MNLPSEISSGSNGCSSSTTSFDSPNSQNSDPFTQPAPLTRSQIITRNGILSGTNGYCTPGRSIRNSFLQGETRINIAPEYQVHIPDCDPVQCLEDYSKDEDSEETQSICLWTPQEDDVISDREVTKFCDLANEKHGFSVEQSLGILQFSNFDYNEAVKSLDEYRPILKEWSEEDKVLFEQMLACNGKRLQRIKLVLPDKSIADIVEHYYLRKKKPRHTSFAEQAYKKRKAVWIDEMDDLDLEQSYEPEIKRVCFDPCSNCRIPSAQLQRTKKGRLCGRCFLNLRRTRREKRKLETQPMVNGGSPPSICVPNGPISNCISKEYCAQNERNRLVPPPDDMGLNVIEFLDYSLKPNSMVAQKQAVLMKLSVDLEKMRQKSMANCAKFGHIQRGQISNRYGLNGNLHNIVHLRRDNAQFKRRIDFKWAAYEILLAVQGFRRFGKNFQTIAEIIGSKTEQHVRYFYNNYKKQYKLDELIAQFDRGFSDFSSSARKQKKYRP